jgi:lipoprotein-anchoring transpeptidase ErfK/SrfK
MKLKKLFFIFTFLLSSSCSAESPEQVVKKFYNAASINDCATTMLLRKPYSVDSCKQLSHTRVNSVKTLETIGNTAILHLDVEYLLRGNPVHFKGFMRMDHTANGWIISNDFKSEDTISLDDYILQTMAGSQSTQARPAQFTRKIQRKAALQPMPPMKNHHDQIQYLLQKYPEYAQKQILLVSVAEQKLYVYRNHTLHAEYRISTATKGTGSKKGSDKTPLGAHRVSERFGDGARPGTIFKARQNTGKIADIITEDKDIPQDYVTTRILWLDGLEKGKNKGGNVDSHSRYIYIHGTPEEGLIGRPASHGCIRMYNKDVISLFNMTPLDSLVYIME